MRASQKPATLLPELNCVDHVVPFEYEQAPWLRCGRLACLRGLVVFEGDLGALNAVGMLGKRASRLKIGLFLVDRRAAILRGCLVGVIDAAEGDLLVGQRLLIALVRRP